MTSGRIAAVIFVGLILVLGAGLLVSSFSAKAEPPVRPIASEAGLPASSDPTPVAIAPVEPKPAALLPTEVSRDAGVVARARPLKPATDPTKDPSELELK